MTKKHESCFIAARDQRGMTLIEVIVAVAITLLVGSAVILFHRTVIVTTQIAQTNLTIQQQVRRTLSLFTFELRSAKPSAGGAYAIESAGTSSVVFFSNIDTTTDVERVRYFLSTSTSANVYDVIKKGIIKPVGTTYSSANETISIIARSVRNASSTPLFTYFGTNYAGTSSPLATPINISNIRHVRMDIRVEERAGRGTTSRAYMTHVSIRQLKDNY
jgi:prepilin-type N-terminal cleavage/methylation domain-containing protein